MKMRKSKFVISVALAGVVAATVAFALASTSDAQRARLGKVQSLQATVDKGGVHPSSADITNTVKITCMNSVSETPNSQPAPGCHIVAPGYTGNLAKGQVINATGPGTVTLTCTGQGFLRCSARVDIPPAS